MFTRQRQLGGQIAPGTTLFPVFLLLLRYHNRLESTCLRKKDEVETADQLYFHRHTRQFNCYKAAVNYFPISNSR